MNIISELCLYTRVPQPKYISFRHWY